MFDTNLHWKKYADFHAQKSHLQDLSMCEHSILVFINLAIFSAIMYRHKKYELLKFYNNGLNEFFRGIEKKKSKFS